MNKNKQNNKEKKSINAFTLVELLIVIAIIGILTTLIVLSLQNVRRSARDAKRIADINQLQLALELYISDNGFYPPNINFGESLSSGEVIYMEEVPQAPTPPDGDCDSITNEYSYISIGADNSSYTISFCLGNNTGSLPAGKVVASPQSLVEDLSSWTCGENLIDGRDNQSYATKQYGDQCWFVENLNIGTRIDGDYHQLDDSIIQKFCYDDLESNCDNGYGGLYQWTEAMNYDTSTTQGICPDGWHIATSGEWNILVNYVNTPSLNYRCNGISDSLGKAFASNNGWISTTTECMVGNNQQTNNATGFNASPAGYRDYTNGSFTRSWSTYIWSSIFGPEILEGRAGYRALHYSSTTFYPSGDYYAYGLSVRCLKTN